MRMVRVTLLLVIFLAVLIPWDSVLAGDYVQDAIEALQASNVYVAPGTPGTDYNTPSKLGIFLRPDDNIVLVMLPPEALTGTDMYSIAQKISAGLGDQKTIGLAVGREVIGYSPLLPEGVAADKMRRANSVSNDPVTALITYTQNIHSWLADNPLPTPKPKPTAVPTPRPTMEPIELPKAEDVSWPVWALSFLCFLGVGVILARVLAGVVRKNRTMVVKKKRLASLKPIEIWIEKIENNVATISDVRIRADLERACQAAHGQLEIFRASDTQLGYTEAKYPSLLENVNRQVVALIRHESRRRPLSPEVLAQLKQVLMNYDSFFIKLQENDPEAVQLLTSIIDSNNAMIASMGYLPEGK